MTGIGEGRCYHPCVATYIPSQHALWRKPWRHTALRAVWSHMRIAKTANGALGSAGRNGCVKQSWTWCFRAWAGSRSHQLTFGAMLAGNALLTQPRYAYTILLFLRSICLTLVTFSLRLHAMWSSCLQFSVYGALGIECQLRAPMLPFEASGTSRSDWKE